MMNYKLRAHSHIDDLVVSLKNWRNSIVNHIFLALPSSDITKTYEWEYCKLLIKSLHDQLDFNFLLENSKHVSEKDLATLRLIHDAECIMIKFEAGTIDKCELEKFVFDNIEEEKQLEIPST